MNFQRFTLAIAALVMGATVTVLPAQESVVLIDDDDFTFRGCVRRMNGQLSTPANILVWSRGDIMLDAVTALGGGDRPIGTSGLTGRVFYWLDNHDDEDLASHVGQLVEVEGDLKDFETGEVKFDREGELTEIKIKVDGREEKLRVPTSWVSGLGAAREEEFDIVTRRVDVHHVRLIGACN